MTSGRKPKPPAPRLELKHDDEAIANTSKAVDALALMDEEAQQRTHKLATRLGYDGPLDADVIERGVTLQMRRTVEACLETGRMLLILKERVGHGNFIERLQRLGIEPKGAQKFMHAALKFSNGAPSRHLTAAATNPSKLIELLVLDDDQTEELLTEGSVLGITSDEFGAMTRKEMREALRAKDTLLKKKAEAHDALVLKHEALRKFKPSPDAVARNAEQQAMLESLNEYSCKAQVALLQLAGVANTVFDDYHDSPLAKHARACLEFMATEFEQLATTHDIHLDMAKRLEPPPWMSDEMAKAIKKHRDA